MGNAASLNNSNGMHAALAATLRREALLYTKSFCFCSKKLSDSLRMVRSWIAVLIAGSVAVVNGATWNKTGGGNLDDAGNWQNAGTTYAIRQQQTAPFTISADKAKLPSGATSSMFQYDYSPRFYTNHFASGWTLAHNGFLYVQGGASLVQGSGVMSPSAGSVVTAQDIGGNVTTTNTRYVVSGSSAGHDGNYIRVMAASSGVSGPVQPELIVENGASVNLSQGLELYGGWSVSRSLVTGEGSSLTAGNLAMGGSQGETSPGLVRELAFDEHATGIFSSASTLGLLSGGNRLAVRNGASVSFGAGVNLSSPENATSNNVIEVCGGMMTIAGSLTIGSSNGSWGNGVVVRDGGEVRLTGSENAVLEVGNPGTDNFVMVSGLNSLLDCGSIKVFVGGRTGARDGTHDRNVMTIADGASFSSGSDVHVGRLGNDCRLSVTNGSTFVADKLCMYTNGVFYAERATVTITNGVTFADGGGEVTFKDSTVHFVMPSTLNLDSNGGVISFIGSEVDANHRINPVGSMFTMRLDDSRYTFNPDEWFMTGMQADASESRRYVFEGADPHLKITGSNGMYMRGKVTLEFNLSRAGFPMGHPVIDLQHASSKFSGDAATKADRALVVNVADNCPPGTYTLLRGTDADKLFVDGTIICTSKRAKVNTATVDGVAELQVRVSGGLIVVMR